MGRRWVGAVAMVVLLGGCGEEPARDRRDTAAVVAEYRRSHAEADRALERLRERGEPASDARTRRAAQTCLRLWRAAPETAHGELLALWEVAATREAFARKRAVIAAWIRRLRAIRGVEQVRRIRIRRDAVEADYARLSELYARPIPLCKVLREWHRRGWEPPMPAAVARVVRLTDQPPRPRGAFGVGMPDHNGYCDPVFATLSPDDVFCG